MARHKWNGPPPKSKVVDEIVTACVKCGMVRQWVRGYPTYFLNDTVYDKKAPPCKGKKHHDNSEIS
jgi:hypothetical protein